jgi:putative peptidoglycan lipid II flippase
VSRAIGIASLVWGASILLSRLLGLVREAVIGRVLGGGAEADVFFLAFVIPDFLNYLLAGGVLSIVFIPIFQGHLARGDAAAGWRAFSVIANFLVVTLTLATAALWVATPALTPLVGPGLDAAGDAELVRLVRIVLPAQIFHLVGGLLSATLMARDQHRLPALAPLIYTACIIVGGLALGPSLGAAGFCWGVLVGSVLGPFGLPLYGAIRQRDFAWNMTLSMRNADFKTYIWRSLPVMLGFSVVAVDDWIVKHHATEVAEGAVARLQYARTLMKVPMGVFGLAAGVAAYPTLARLVAEGKPGEMFATLMKALRLMVVLAAVAGAALAASAEDVATVIWGVRRFSPAALADIGLYTGLFCLGLWAWSAQMLVARGFYAQGNTWLPTLSGTAVAAAAFPLYGVLAARWGAAGLTVASSVAISAYVAVLLGLLRRSVGGAPGVGGFFGVLARVAAAAVLGAVAGWALRGWLADTTRLPALVRGAVAGVAGGGVASSLSVALGVGEVRVVIGRVMGRVRRRAG